MDLDRMLEQCRRYQWSIDDLDWSETPPPLDREKELAVVQYFTNMSGVELLAAELFKYQRDHTNDPTLRAILETFVVDEERHAAVATRLARYYDRHKYRRYRVNPHLLRFRYSFLEVLKHISPEIATYYVTTGEIFLDVALLRSLNDFVDDQMSQQAMDRINRDESRHIAIDFHMMETYTSDEYLRRRRRLPRPSLRERARTAKAMAEFLYYAGPFLRDVFFEPIDFADPSGRRLRQAFKRVQLSGNNPQVKRRPFPRFTQALQDIFNHPSSGPLVRRAASRALGLDPRVITPLFTQEELREAQRMSFEEHAEAVLKEKTQQ